MKKILYLMFACIVIFGEQLFMPKITEAQDIWAYTDSNNGVQYYVVTESIKNTSTGQFELDVKTIYPNGRYSRNRIGFGNDEGDVWSNGGVRVRQVPYLRAIYNVMVKYAPNIYQRRPYEL